MTWKQDIESVNCVCKRCGDDLCAEEETLADGEVVCVVEPCARCLENEASAARYSANEEVRAVRARMRAEEEHHASERYMLEGKLRRLQK